MVFCDPQSRCRRIPQEDLPIAWTAMQFPCSKLEVFPWSFLPIQDRLLKLSARSKKGSKKETQSQFFPMCSLKPAQQGCDLQPPTSKWGFGRFVRHRSRHRVPLLSRPVDGLTS